MDIDLRGRVFLIGGGSRGLGRATARALIGEGARAVLVARDRAGLDVAAEQLGTAGVETVAADLADPAAPAIAVAAAHRRFGRLDGALINTGGPATGAADELDDGSWADAVRATFLAPIRLARVVADDLRQHAGGAIAFVLSTSVRAPLTSLALSNAIRPGLAGHVKDLADAYGPPPNPVRVVGLLPARVETDRSTVAGPRRPEVEARIPLRRYGRAEEFGRVAAFLLSPAASYVTGSLVTVDGGFSRAV